MKLNYQPFKKNISETKLVELVMQSRPLNSIKFSSWKLSKSYSNKANLHYYAMTKFKEQV